MRSSCVYFPSRSLRGKENDWLVAFSKGTIAGMNAPNIFMTKFFAPGKTMQLRSNITSFRLEDGEPLSLACEWMNKSIMSNPGHGMEEWLLLHLFYNGLNTMS
jgi:hypothetical protein